MVMIMCLDNCCDQGNVWINDGCDICRAMNIFLPIDAEFDLFAEIQNGRTEDAECPGCYGDALLLIDK